MNYFGSYRRLLANSKSAMLGAIELYNRPRFEYRDEVFVILLVNAWELLIKAVLSKGRIRIYYPKERNRPYRTLGWRDGLNRARDAGLWPSAVHGAVVEANLDRLTVFRDRAIHFYNAPGFGTVIYGLAQANVFNYRDVLAEVFGQDLSAEMNWELLPLGLKPPLDALSYLGAGRPRTGNRAVEEFLATLRQRVADLDVEGVDTGRLMTVYEVGLQSVKKLEKADIVLGVDGYAGGGHALLVKRKVLPPESHPLLMKDVLEKVGQRLDGRRFNQYDFHAVVYHLELRGDTRWWYEDLGRVRWSGDLPAYIKGLSVEQLEAARAAYRDRPRDKRS